jgi:hypothetical protein
MYITKQAFLTPSISDENIFLPKSTDLWKLEKKFSHAAPTGQWPSRHKASGEPLLKRPPSAAFVA